MNPHIELVPIDSVLQDPENARLHSKEQLKYIAASLERFSQQKPIVVGKDNIIIAGNGTHLAAKEILNWKDILIIRSELNSEEARAYGIADNQISTHSEWDVEALSKHIKDMAEWNPMQDWTSIGFESDIIDPLIEDSKSEDNLASDSLINFLEGKENYEKEGKAEDKAIMAKPIKVTEEQWEVIDQAINIIKFQTEDMKITAGRALELICGDFLSGSYYVEESDR